MAGFCKACGSPLNDGVVFCQSCGTNNSSAPVPPVNVAPPAQPQFTQPQYAQPQYGYQPIPKKKNTGVIVGVVLAFVLIVIIGIVVVIVLSNGKNGNSIFSNSNNNYKQPVTNLYHSWETSNWNQFVSCYPSEISSILAKGYKGLGYDNGDDFLKEYLYSPIEKQFGKNVKLSVSFDSDSSLSSDDIKSYEEDYSSYYKVNVNITEAHKILYTILVKGDDSSSTEEATVIVGKIGSTWYIIEDDFLKGFTSTYN